MGVYELVGTECLRAGLIDSALDWFTKATKICQKYGESEKLADCILNQALALKQISLDKAVS